MENLPKFVKSLSTGNIVEIKDRDRTYYDNMIRKHKVKDLIYLDEYEQIIGDLELNEEETETYIKEADKFYEERLGELTKKKDRLDELESDLEKRESALQVREIEVINSEEKAIEKGKLKKTK